MSISVIDWLYIDNLTSSKDNISKQHNLIVYPRTFDRWNITSMIVSKWDKYKVVIITDNPDEFMESIINIPTESRDNKNHDKHIEKYTDIITKWTDLELIPFTLIKYSDIGNINKALSNTEIDIIIFDNARMLSIIAPALVPSTNMLSPKIFILTTWGDTSAQINVIINKFPDLSLFSFNNIGNLTSIDWKYTQTSMSDKQLLYYNQIRSYEINNTDQHILQYPITRMATLYTYPDNIMNDILSHKYICETNHLSSPDTLADSTWLNTSFIYSLFDDGPKLLFILDSIFSYCPSKQLIVTRFNHRFGVDLITSFLKLTSLLNTNPYSSDDILHTSCSDDYESSVNTFHKFNSLSNAILITNLVPLVPLKDVHIVHLTDSYSFQNAQTIIDRLHKLSDKNLTILSHLATHPSELSSDQVLYDDLISRVSASNNLYYNLISSGKPLKLDYIHGLVI